jgi:TonB family protein
MTTMIADSTQGKTIGVGLNANRTTRSSNPEAWKEHIGNRQVPARLALLPDSKPRWDRIGVSAGIQVAATIFFLLIPLMYPEGMKTALHYNSVEIAQPLTEIPVAPPPPPPAAPKVVVKKADVPPPETPQLNPKQPHIFQNLAPKKIEPKVERVVEKIPDMAPAFEPAKIDAKENGPKRPKEDVKTGLIASTGSAAPATVKAPVDKVQTGGFGDPNGMPGKGDPNHATNVNRLGSPALPGGEGYGNGTGGKNGIAGTVASTGFGNGVATPPTGGGGKKGVVVASGFGDAAAVTEAPKKKTQAGGPPDTGIIVQDKPRPEYTAEARNLKIEGDVVLDLVFLANGNIQINRVVSGLGHGLDEAAERAAQQIRFKPAQREHEPVDFPARVRIEFRLAY